MPKSDTRYRVTFTAPGTDFGHRYFDTLDRAVQEVEAMSRDKMWPPCSFRIEVTDSPRFAYMIRGGRRKPAWRIVSSGKVTLGSVEYTGDPPAGASTKTTPGDSAVTERVIVTPFDLRQSDEFAAAGDIWMVHYTTDTQVRAIRQTYWGTLAQNVGSLAFRKSTGKAVGRAVVMDVDQARVAKLREEIFWQIREQQEKEEAERQARDAARAEREATPEFKLAKRIAHESRYSWDFPETWCDLGMDILKQVEAALIKLGSLKPQEQDNGEEAAKPS